MALTWTIGDYTIKGPSKVQISDSKRVIVEAGIDNELVSVVRGDRKKTISATWNFIETLSARNALRELDNGIQYCTIYYNDDTPVSGYYALEQSPSYNMEYNGTTWVYTNLSVDLREV